MRVAVRAAACAMDRLLNYIEIGMDEMHVSQVVSRFMLEEGGDRLSHAQVMSQGSGARFGSCDALDRPVERGWVNLDIGCKYRRYGSDINRGVFLGREPTPEERKLYECRKGVNEFLDGYIKPGVVMDDALYAMKAYVEAQGCQLLENRGSLFGGHAIGLENYQHPSFTLGDNQPEFKGADGQVRFETGMMFTYEMPLRLPGHDIAFNIEDDVVVTAEGVENMSAMVTRDMRVKL
jgi:Xaa-Pro aminopeptidase